MGNISISLSKVAENRLRQMVRETGQKKSSVVDYLIRQSNTKKYLALQIIAHEEDADACRSLLSKLMRLETAQEEMNDPNKNMLLKKGGFDE